MTKYCQHGQEQRHSYLTCHAVEVLDEHMGTDVHATDRLLLKYPKVRSRASGDQAGTTIGLIFPGR